MPCFKAMPYFERPVILWHYPSRFSPLLFQSRVQLTIKSISLKRKMGQFVKLETEKNKEIATGSQ